MQKKKQRNRYSFIRDTLRPVVLRNIKKKNGKNLIPIEMIRIQKIKKKM